LSRPPYLSQEQTQVRIEWMRSFSILGKLDNFAKRLLDIFAATVGLFFLLPFFALIGILIKRDSPGPVIFRGKRLGKNGRIFQMLKFRTMYDNPISYDGPRLTCKYDDRITPFGSWLRNTKVNELPQLWNVLIGDMSLVGPRPEDNVIGNDWDENTRKAILSVRPGITSPASILYHDEESLLSKDNIIEDYFKNILPDKMRLDLLYVRNRSFGSDLDIILWTLIIIVPITIQETIPEGYLFSGLFARFINRYAFWYLIDIITTLLVIAIVGWLWRIQIPLNWGIQNLTILAIVLAFIFSGVNSILRLDRIEWSSATTNNVIVLALSGWFVTFVWWLFNYFLLAYHWFNLEPLPTSMILIIGFLAQVGFIASRFRYRIISAIANIWLSWRRNVLDIGEKVLIVGAGENLSTANWLLKRNEFQYIFKIIGVVDDNIPSKHGMLLNGCLVLGCVADLPKIVKKEKIGVIVFTTLNIPQDIKEYADNLKTNSNVRLIFLDNLSNIISQQLTSPVVPLAYSSWSEGYLKYLALHDVITGLPNQILFENSLRHAIALAKRYKTQPKVMFIDLDISKNNQKIEQKTWNEIIRKVTERLQKIRRESDTLAFLGIYGFAFIFDNNCDDNAIKTIVKRILKSLTQPIHFKGLTIILSTTIHISTEFENSSTVMESGKEGILLDYLIANRQIYQDII